MQETQTKFQKLNNSYSFTVLYHNLCNKFDILMTFLWMYSVRQITNNFHWVSFEYL